MFRTELTITPQAQLLGRGARVLTVGSCFAESLGERLQQHKVATLANPFGTVFQPLALAQLLRAAGGEAQDWQQHLVEARGRWQSYDFHGTVGADDPVTLLQTIQERVRQVGEFVRGADLLVLTLGTAWAYRLRETGELVSNLHKQPAAKFERELLTADEIVNALAEVHARLRRLNPKLRIVLTVSPVRHLKETLPLNAVSKSALRVACHYLSELLPGVSYFPAYELLLDDLRDYRFYGGDMLHPSDVAQDYVWDKFARAYFDADFGRFRQEWAAVRRSLEHRPLHEGAPEHRHFLDQTRERLARLVEQGVDAKAELRDVQRRLAALPPPRPVAPAPEPEDDGEERIDIGGDDSASAEMAGASQAAVKESAPGARPASPAPGAASSRRADERGRADERNRGRRGDRRPGTDSRRSAPEVAPPTAKPVDPAAEPLPLTTSGEAELPAALPKQSATPDPALVPAEDTTAYPAKKKKRRSRGGAKRTARKHAARLAAEQATDATVATPVPGEAKPDTLEPIAALAQPELAVLAVPTAEALDESAATAAVEPTDLAATEAPPQVEAEAEASPAPPPRRRGTGPAPKKSKVIEKSKPVARDRRRPALFAPSANGEPAPTAATVETPAPPTPNVADATAPTPEAPAAPAPAPETLAMSVLGLNRPKSPPLPTKRGRPKRTAPAAISAEAQPAPAGAPETTGTVEAPAAPAAAAEPEAARAAGQPKRAARASQPAPEGNEGAAPRRGRPPGKKKTAPAEAAG